MIYKDIIINYFIADDQGGMQSIPYELYREHASTDGYLVKYVSHVNEVTAVMHMDIVLVPSYKIL